MARAARKPPDVDVTMQDAPLTETDAQASLRRSEADAGGGVGRLASRLGEGPEEPLQR